MPSPPDDYAIQPSEPKQESSSTELGERSSGPTLQAQSPPTSTDYPAAQGPLENPILLGTQAGQDSSDRDHEDHSRRHQTNTHRQDDHKELGHSARDPGYRDSITPTTPLQKRKPVVPESTESSRHVYPTRMNRTNALSESPLEASAEASPEIRLTGPPQQSFSPQVQGRRDALPVVPITQQNTYDGRSDRISRGQDLPDREPRDDSEHFRFISRLRSLVEDDSEKQLRIGAASQSPASSDGDYLMGELLPARSDHSDGTTHDSTSTTAPGVHDDRNLNIRPSDSITGDHITTDQPNNSPAGRAYSPDDLMRSFLGASPTPESSPEPPSSSPPETMASSSSFRPVTERGETPNRSMPSEIMNSEDERERQRRAYSSPEL